jgi:hypothetical protein
MAVLQEAGKTSTENRGLAVEDQLELAVGGERAGGDDPVGGPGWRIDKGERGPRLGREPPKRRIPAIMKVTHLSFLVALISMPVAWSEPLFTAQGTDPTFEELVKRGKLPDGQSSKDGVTGSKVNVNNGLVELTPEARRPIAREIRIHTLANSAIRRGDFGEWSRWYQEDGSTQVFRLFKGETNVHNARENAARIEAFSNVEWKRGTWHEWSGTYTIIKPHGAAIFQAKNNLNDWSVQINMNSSGDVILNHRRGKDQVIAKQRVGKPFLIRVRDNGQDYEVYLDGKKVGEGIYARPAGTTRFRWGMYVGKNAVTQDAMIFVSGATVDGKSGS